MTIVNLFHAEFILMLYYETIYVDSVNPAGLDPSKIKKITISIENI